jgi:hypothetical protein
MAAVVPTEASQAKRRGRPLKDTKKIERDCAMSNAGQLSRDLDLDFLEGGAPAKPDSPAAAIVKRDKNDKRRNHHHSSKLSPTKCPKCKKEKPASEYGAQQSACKACVASDRRFRNVVTKQMGPQFWHSTKTEDATILDDMHKLYDKQQRQAEKDQKPFNFSTKEAFREVSSIRRKGVDTRGKMQCEAEWLEWACGPKGNHTARSKAEEIWQTWMNNKEHPKDKYTPTGATRCLNLWFETIVSNWEGIEDKRTLREGASIKKMSDQDLQKFMVFAPSVSHDQSSH